MTDIAMQHIDKPIASTNQNSYPLTEHDIFLFREGTHTRLAEKMGSHLATRDGRDGVHFAVWAPNASTVSVIGDFNSWRNTDNPAFEPEPMTPEDLAAWSSRLHAETAITLDALEDRRESLSGELRAASDRLLSLRPTLLDRTSPSALAGIALTKMRYHGDYHLGQVLLAENDFIITDFEGEPARPMLERSQKHSPLRDVAGMLRSFSYASAVAANRATTDRPADHAQIAPLVKTWEQEVSAAFLTGYRNVIQGCTACPAGPGEMDRLIGVFIIEKALYELRYELNNRPDWLAIPLFSLLSALDRPAA